MSRMNIVMTLLVRDEADVLESNLRYHLAQGVAFFVAMDNNSADESAEILRRYESAGFLHLMPQPAGEKFSTHGGAWRTRMARMAATSFNADWVINNDADEFWWPARGDLTDVFSAVPEPFSLLSAHRPEFIGRPDGPGSFTERLVVRQRVSHTPRKVAHRARADISIGRGVHKVKAIQGSDARQPPYHFPGRVVDRALRADDLGEEDRLLLAPMWPVRILHYPLRSFEQYKRRVEVNLHEFRDSPRSRVLRRYYEEGRLAELYTRMTLTDTEVRAGLLTGTYIVDHCLRDFLRGCPDPLTSGESRPRGRGRSLADSNDAHELERELTSVQLDVLHGALVRLEQTTSQGHRASRRRLKAVEQHVKQLEDERARLAARIEMLERNAWRRTRLAVGRILKRSGQ